MKHGFYSVAGAGAAGYESGTKIGSYDIAGNEYGNFTLDYILGFKITLEYSSTMTGFGGKWGYTGLEGNRKFRMGLYDDTGTSNGPGALMATTGLTYHPQADAIAQDDTEFSITPVSLDAGDYYIMAVYILSTNPGPGKSDAGVITTYYRAFSNPLTTSLPETFGTALTYSGDLIKYWIIL